MSDNEKTPSGKLKRHLRIIITNPDFENNYVVITVQTLRGTFMDTTCIIEKGEHPFIKHTSVVNFSKTLMMNEHEIINGIQRGLLIDKRIYRKVFWKNFKKPLYLQTKFLKI